MDAFTDYLGNRLKRDTASDENADIDEEVDEKYLSTTPKENYGSLAILRTTKETNKFGFVDIDLVPQSVVLSLRDNSSKHSRFKNFFKKFHFKKKKPKTYKDRKAFKRQCYITNRRSRFNPIRKLKNMFKVRTEDEKPSHNPPNYRAPNVPDYDMITSHIDTFKQIKYDKPLSIDEMKKQIPNISDVIEPETTLHTSTSRPPAYSYKLDDKDRDLLYHYHIPHSTPKTATVEVLSEFRFMFNHTCTCN